VNRLETLVERKGQLLDPDRMTDDSFLTAQEDRRSLMHDSRENNPNETILGAVGPAGEG